MIGFFLKYLYLFPIFSNFYLVYLTNNPALWSTLFTKWIFFSPNSSSFAYNLKENTLFFHKPQEVPSAYLKEDNEHFAV